MLLTATRDPVGDLYVPAAAIALEREEHDLREAFGLDFTQVEVDLQINVAGQFRFTIPRAFDIAKRDFVTRFGEPLMPILKLGRRIWIKFGYGDLTRSKPIFSGYITGLSTSFAEGGAPEIEVSGTDATYPMTLGKSQHQYIGKSLKDVVADIVKKNGLALDFKGEPDGKLPLDSNNESDLEFLIKLVKNFSPDADQWVFYARPKNGTDTFFCRPREIDAKELTALVWGSDLIGFKPEINLGDQVKSVEVHGWDEERGEAIKVEVFRDKGKKGEPGGGEVNQAQLGRESKLILKLPVRTKEEAEQRAKAAMAERSNNLFKGEGETFGVSELLPDMVLKLEGLGQQYSTTYYVTKTVHRYDTSGYRTRFSLERPVL